MQEEIEDNWTRVRSGMTWVKMPRDAVKVVSALRYTGYRRGNPEEDKKKLLAGLSEECIEAGMKYLKEHENYIISKRTKQYGHGEEHVICKKPNMMYEKPKHWSNNYKGRAATLYGYQMKIPLEEWTRIVAEHWEGRQAIRDENSRAEQQQTLHKAIQNVEREEHDYRCGSSNSSRGHFSWALSYNTKFITKGEREYDEVTEKYVTHPRGQLLPFDEAYEVRSIERMCKGITLPDLVTRVEELTTRYVEARRTYHAHSVVWYQVMNNLYTVIQAVGQQYIGNEEE